jgi:4-carboxymuconolactone decarboxylase
MRVLTISILCAATALAQQPARDLKALGLEGGRFAPPTWEELTPAQRKMIENVLAGPRGNLGGPFNVMLRSPEMGDQLQQFGASMRFLESMPAKLRELAIILTARQWTSEYEWQVHSAAARQAGLSGAVVDAVRDGRRPEKLADDEAVVYTFAMELMTTKQISDATFATKRWRCCSTSIATRCRKARSRN